MSGMSSNKTVPTDGDARAFLGSLDDRQQAEDSEKLVQLFQRVSGEPPVMWGGSIVGFGRTRLVYASGREVDWPVIGFSPRKGKLALYVTFDAAELVGRFPDLGAVTIAKGCIYIKRLADVDEGELEKLVQSAYEAGFVQPERADGKERIVRQRQS